MDFGFIVEISTNANHRDGAYSLLYDLNISTMDIEHYKKGDNAHKPFNLISIPYSSWILM